VPKRKSDLCPNIVADIFMGPTRVDFAGGFIERNQYDANKASWRPPFISKQAVELLWTGN
jgi:hypothetical protein